MCVAMEVYYWRANKWFIIYFRMQWIKYKWAQKVDIWQCCQNKKQIQESPIKNFKPKDHISFIPLMEHDYSFLLCKTVGSIL